MASYPPRVIVAAGVVTPAIVQVSGPHVIKATGTFAGETIQFRSSLDSGATWDDLDGLATTATDGFRIDLVAGELIGATISGGSGAGIGAVLVGS